MALHMDCPRCGAKSKDNICNLCGVDIALYKKAQNMAHVYYNKGLKAAKTGDITLATECLNASLKINKKHMQARNLLGLCYYSSGRIGDALKQWVISTNYEENDNLAKDYLDSFQNGISYLEAYSEGLRNYNEALHFMVQYSEDLAAIRLKRAIEIIPNFVEALNLLALFYIKTGEKTRAASLVERVLAIDNGNAAARRYYQAIFQKKAPDPRKPEQIVEKTAPKQMQRQFQTINTNAASSAKNNNQNPFAVQKQRVFTKASPISGILSFVVGLGAMFLFMYVLIIPAFLEDRIAEIDYLSTNLENLETTHYAEITELDDIVSDLRQQIGELVSQALSQNEENINLQNENRVNSSHVYLTMQMHSQALMLLEDVDTARLTDDLLQIYNHVRSESMPVVSQYYYTMGQDLFNAGEYSGARIALERAASNITEGSAIAHHIFYFLGRTAEAEDDFTLARSYYEIIINNFPGSNRVNAANARLAAISD